jgi:hypothetical protein
MWEIAVKDRNEDFIRFLLSRGFKAGSCQFSLLEMAIRRACTADNKDWEKDLLFAQFLVNQGALDSHKTVFDLVHKCYQREPVKGTAIGKQLYRNGVRWPQWYHSYPSVYEDFISAISGKLPESAAAKPVPQGTSPAVDRAVAEACNDQNHDWKRDLEQALSLMREGVLASADAFRWAHKCYGEKPLRAVEIGKALYTAGVRPPGGDQRDESYRRFIEEVLAQGDPVRMAPVRSAPQVSAIPEIDWLTEESLKKLPEEVQGKISVLQRVFQAPWDKGLWESLLGRPDRDRFSSAFTQLLLRLHPDKYPQEMKEFFTPVWIAVKERREVVRNLLFP